MLVLIRKRLERIKINGPCEITVCDIRGNRGGKKSVAIGIEADPKVKIVRGELDDREPASPTVGSEVKP